MFDFNLEDIFNNFKKSDSVYSDTNTSHVRTTTELLLLLRHTHKQTGTLTVEQIYQDRETFAHLVREVASPDVGRMGIEILSFVIKDVVDSVEYLTSIGRAQTAVVKGNAAIGVAEAEKEAGIVVSC